MTSPTRVVTAQGSDRDVKTTPGPASTPHEPTTELAVVDVLVVGRVEGGRAERAGEEVHPESTIDSVVNSAPASALRPMTTTPWAVTVMGSGGFRHEVLSPTGRVVSTSIAREERRSHERA
jgi:hypothetical protein